MLLTILSSEYLRRVRSKAFILTTLLAPIVLAVVMAGALAAVIYSVESESARDRRLTVLDESGRILPELRGRNHESYRVAAAPPSLEDAKQAVIDGEADVLLILPSELAQAGGATDLTAYVKGKQSITAEQTLRRFVLDVVRDVRLAEYELPAEVLDTLSERLSLTTVAVTDSGDEEAGSTAASVAVGLAVGIVMLMVIWIYGVMLMQTTMEEKTSRMAEILISSVRPFELLMGKILAIGGVACTQLAVWAVMFAAFGALAVAVLPIENLIEELGAAASSEQGGGVGAFEQGSGAAALPDIRFDVVVVVLLMLPLGYLINASLFGALGAMYETPQEAQIAVGVAMAPMMVSILMVQTAALAPNSTFVVFGAFFPFTAPVMLPTRMLVADMPVWQVLVSIALCTGSALGVVWLAGRAFRGSLLIYGKKFRPKDIWQILVAD